MGRIRKLEIEKHHGFELVALCDQNESIAAEFSTISFYKNWKLLLDEKLRNSMGSAGRAWIEKEWRWQIWAGKFSELLAR